jgi:hypothetical protein
MHRMVGAKLPDPVQNHFVVRCAGRSPSYQMRVLSVYLSLPLTLCLQECCLAHDPARRPPMSIMLRHPIFMKAEARLLYLKKAFEVADDRLRCVDCCWAMYVVVCGF